uniref:Holin n=1 Tax=Siphoviridae sp. ctiMP24 TaxID=2825621 RepID=A0A8S5P0Q9_9CAUD|nr:MAG TPA: holin [Siphoviridae sp. ctiMP24]
MPIKNGKISALNFRKGVLHMKINWKQKLTSRKFWAAVVTFVTTVLVAFGVPDLTIEQVTAIITAGASMIAYIIGEGLVDAARIKAQAGTAEQAGVANDGSK